jgi:hypothetical protein
MEFPVGEKHLGDNLGCKTNNFMSKCFALPSRKKFDRNFALPSRKNLGAIELFIAAKYVAIALQ